MRNPLHQAAIAHKYVGEVIDNFVFRLVNLRRQRALGDSQTHGICQSLPQRTGGGFHSRRIANLRVTRGF